MGSEAGKEAERVWKPDWWKEYPNQNLSLEQWLSLVPESIESRNRSKLSIYSKELAIRILLEWHRTGNLTFACKKNGVYRNNIYRWRDFYPEFHQMFKITRERVNTRKYRDPKFKRVKMWREGKIPDLTDFQKKYRQRSLYRPEYADLAKTLSVKEIAARVGVTRETVSRWRHKHPEFKRALDRKYINKHLPKVIDENVELLKKGIQAGLI